MFAIYANKFYMLNFYFELNHFKLVKDLDDIINSRLDGKFTRR